MHAATHQQWAAPLALPEPGCGRDWQHGLPPDVLSVCLGRLAAAGDGRALAAARGACTSWRGAADACVRELNLR